MLANPAKLLAKKLAIKKQARSKSESSSRTQIFKPIRPTPKTPQSKKKHLHDRHHNHSREMLPTMPFKPTKRSSLMKDAQYRKALNISSLDTKFRIHMVNDTLGTLCTRPDTDLRTAAEEPFGGEPSPVFSDALSDYEGDEMSAWRVENTLATRETVTDSPMSDHSSVFDGILSPSFDAPSWELSEIQQSTGLHHVEPYTAAYHRCVAIGVAKCLFFHSLLCSCSASTVVM